MTLNNNYQLVVQSYLGNSGYGNVYIRTYAKLNSQSIANNKSNISVQARIYTEGAYWYATSGTTYRITGSNSIDSGTVSCNAQYNVGETTLGTVTKDIPHYDNGIRTIHLESNFASQPWGWNDTAGASNIKLPDIPRASSVSCSSPYIGDTATITIGKKVSSFTSTVTYKIGTLTGTIATKTGETVLSLNTEPLKEQIYTLIPNSKSTTGVITCTTYNGNTKIGDSTTANFNLYAKEDECKPNVSGTVIDTNEKTLSIAGSNTKFIKYASKPKVTINAIAKNSATIKNYSINLNDGQSSQLQENIFDTIGSNSVTVDATDSRGYNNPTTLELDMIDYIELHINKVNLERPEGTSNEVILNCNGVWFNDSFNENTPNTLSISFQYKESGAIDWVDGGEITPTIDGNTFKFNNYSLGNIFDYDKEYQIKIIASDLLMTVGSTDKDAQTVQKGLEVWWESEDGIGVNGHIWLNDEDIMKKNCITVFSSNQTHIGAQWSVVQIKLTDEIKIGDAFSRVDNAVEINKDMKGVIASAALSLTNDSYSYSGDLYIRQFRNGQSVKDYCCRGYDGCGLKTVFAPPILFDDVKTGDKFLLGHYTGSTNHQFTTINDKSTYLTLIEV